MHIHRYRLRRRALEVICPKCLGRMGNAGGNLYYCPNCELWLEVKG